TAAGSASVSIGSPTGPWWRSSFTKHTVWSRLLRQPHGIKLLIEVVRRRDRPAADLGAVGHDAVPLQRAEVVHLLVEQSLLEGAQIPLALFGIDRARLLDVEVVQHRVLVPTVVVVRDPD